MALITTNSNIAFILVIGLGVVLGAAEDFLENNRFKHTISRALEELDEGDIKLENNVSLMTYAPNRYISELDINRLLKDSHGKSGIFIYSYSGESPYTLSAQGTDKSHYLVNSYLEGYQPFEVENVMMPLYVLSKRKKYALDATQYQGRQEVWQSSRQAFLYPRGDCEDHAIALADWLIEMGEDARVVLGEVDSGGHAWVVLFKNGKEYLLEATQKSGLSKSTPYPIAALFTNYRPKFMFNRSSFWVNTGTEFTTDYSSSNWVYKSDISKRI